MIQDPPKRVYNPVTRGTLQVVEGIFEKQLRIAELLCMELMEEH